MTVTIRPLRADDAGIIVGFHENTDADFLGQWAGRFYTYPITKEQIAERIKSTGNTRHFAILLKNTVIGTAELDFIKWEEKICSVCRFLLGKAYRGKGYGFQALELLCDYAFEELKMETVKLTVFDFNTPAYRCYLKAGFHVTGEEIRKNGWKAIFMQRSRE